MKKIILATAALLIGVFAVTAIAHNQMVKADKAFVASGGKIKGCASLEYNDGIVCIKPITITQQ